MALKEKVNQIMLSNELNGQQKLDALRALVPAKVHRIKFSKMAKASPAELIIAIIVCSASFTPSRSASSFLPCWRGLLALCLLKAAIRFQRLFLLIQPVYLPLQLLPLPLSAVASFFPHLRHHYESAPTLSSTLRPVRRALLAHR